MGNTVPKPNPRSAVKEGAEEVKEKLKSDLSDVKDKLARSRRGVSLKPMMGCVTCDTTGKLPCTGCNGSGHTKVVFNDEPVACATCEGAGHVTCVDCAGRGQVPNKHRKRIKTLLIIGGIAWALVLLRLWFMDHDILPEQQAYIFKSGGGKAAPSRGSMSGGGGMNLPGRPNDTPATMKNNDAGGAGPINRLPGHMPAPPSPGGSSSGQ